MTPLEHPNVVVIKNIYYPKGLTQQNIYDYYQSAKLKILKETDTREMLFFINIAVNKPIIKRYAAHKQFLKITKSNYNTIITGRTVALISTMKQRERFGIIDIDYHDFNKIKEVTCEVYDYLITKNFKNIKIRYTGKTGFHIICDFGRYYSIDNIRIMLKEILETKFKDKYDIAFKRRRIRPNLDLSVNKFRGGFITQHSLSVLGLKCVEVNRRNIIKFRQIFAHI